MKKPLRWRRRKHEGRIGAAEAFELRQDGKTLAIVQQMKSEDWFCYSMTSLASFNTASRPAPFEDVKKFAESQIRTALSQGN